MCQITVKTPFLLQQLVRVRNGLHLLAKSCRLVPAPHQSFKSEYCDVCSILVFLSSIPQELDYIFWPKLCTFTTVCGQDGESIQSDQASSGTAVLPRTPHTTNCTATGDFTLLSAWLKTSSFHFSVQ